jgi:hypothetical protein
MSCNSCNSFSDCFSTSVRLPERPPVVVLVQSDEFPEPTLPDIIAPPPDVLPLPEQQPVEEAPLGFVRSQPSADQRPRILKVTGQPIVVHQPRLETGSGGFSQRRMANPQRRVSHPPMGASQRRISHPPRGLSQLQRGLSQPQQLGNNCFRKVMKGVNLPELGIVDIDAVICRRQ